MTATGRTLDVFLSKLLPPAILSPNRGERRGGRIPEQISQAKSEMRGDTCLGLLAEQAVREWGDTPADYAHVVFTLRTMSAQRATAMKGMAGKCYRPDDSGNAIYALKAAIDGMIDAGLVVDDSYRHMFHTGIVERVNDLAHEGLRIQVYEILTEPS